MDLNEASADIKQEADENSVCMKGENEKEADNKEAGHTSDEPFDPPDEAAASIWKHALPKRSKMKYYATYDRFMQWTKVKNIKSVSENVLMTYFHDLAKVMKPSTLWSHYSMLKTTLNSQNNIKIEKYTKLTAFLKRQATGFKSKQSKILSSNDIEKFLHEAPDHQYLATKTALIIAITGACRRDELYSIKVDDVKDFNSMFLVTLPKIKRKKLVRSFTIVGEFYAIVKKYCDLRPKDTASHHFFLNYQNGRCTRQVIGINKFGAMPKQIASYLQLPDPQSYTGHSLGRTSANLRIDSGARSDKQHSGSKSATVLEGNIDESLQNKKIVSNLITESIVLNASNSRETSRNESRSTNANPIRTGTPTTGKSSVCEVGESSPPHLDEYAKERKSKTQPVAFVNVNADLDEQNLATGIPTTLPIMSRNPQVSQLPLRDKTSTAQRPRNSAQTFIKQIRNITPAAGSSNQQCEQHLKTLILKTVPLNVKEVAPTTIQMPLRQSAQEVPQAPQQATEVCLRWDSYHSNMQNSFPSLLDAEHFVDVTLACEGRSLKSTESRPFTKIRLQRPTSPASPNATVKLESLDIPLSPIEMFSDNNLMSLHEEEDPCGNVRDSEDQDLNFGNVDGPPDFTDGEDQDQIEFGPADSLEQEQDIVDDLEPNSSAGEREVSSTLYKSEDCEDDEMNEKETREMEAYKKTENAPTEKLKVSEQR
ncbi:uncharacterized protein LOC117176560 [Belonocnema kinseyi]|uniref:uncharacterized protein LOC117176560 n=1 Tax=Belonocnema kinseyi TaxID=2817044 RepID=UPI00143DCCBE|nr:uncharacterized protein LOC117176560 [Belonocnema kinseyi]